MRKYFGGHPVFMVFIGISSIVVGFFFFGFQGWTSARAISHDLMDPASLVVGYSMNIVETLCLLFIFEPMAPAVVKILEHWGLQVSSSAENVEKYLDTIFIFFLALVYLFDGYTTFMGCPSNWDDTICLIIAIGQLFIFEASVNMGLWIITGIKPKLAALEEATKMIPVMRPEE